MVVPSNWITHIRWPPLSNTPPHQNVIEAFIRDLSWQYRLSITFTKSLYRMGSTPARWITTVNQPCQAHEDILSCLRVWRLAKELLILKTKAKAYGVWIRPSHSYTTTETSTKSSSLTIRCNRFDDEESHLDSIFTTNEQLHTVQYGTMRF